MTDDRFLFDHTPGPTLPVAPSLLALRAALAEATRDHLAVPDDVLEREWPWSGHVADVRYGLYRPFEAIEAAGVEVARILRDTTVRRTPGAETIAPATVARWELHGFLTTLEDEVLDRDPGGDEWTVRETLGHLVSSQRAYGWYTAWWAARQPGGPVLDRIPEDVRAAANLPDEAVEGAGSIPDIRGRLDEILDLSAGRLAYLDDAGMALPAAWSGIPVTVGFRLGRWSSHLVEHTIQVNKTLAMLHRRPTEVARLVRRIHTAYGRLEALVFPIDAAALATADERGRSADQVLGALAAELTGDARSVRAAAGA